VVQFTLSGPEPLPTPVCKTWGAFSGNDTIALEGQYVAAEHQGTTRIWNWKKGLYSAYKWDLSLHPYDHDDDVERVSLVNSPYHRSIIVIRHRSIFL
jgi:hypothetical protein